MTVSAVNRRTALRREASFPTQAGNVWLAPGSTSRALIKRHVVASGPAPAWELSPRIREFLEIVARQAATIRAARQSIFSGRDRRYRDRQSGTLIQINDPRCLTMLFVAVLGG